MRYSLKVNVWHGDSEDAVRDAVTDLLPERMTPGLSWSETGVRSSGGWPEIEFHGAAVDLIMIAHAYAGGAVEQDGGTSLLEVLQSVAPIVEAVDALETTPVEPLVV